MPKVLHIIHSLTVGGAARALVAVGKYSARLGPFEHKLAVLDLQHTSPAAVTFALEQGIQVPIARNREEIYREMEDADIVQINWWQHPEMDAFLRSELPAVRLLGWFHCACHRAPQILTAQMVEYFDLVLGCCNHTYRCPAIQRLPEGERQRKAGYVFAGADFERLPEITPQPHSGFRVGYIGTVNFVKMHPRFIALHSGIDIPDLKVVVCGGNMHKILEEEARNAGVGDRFEFRGYVENISRVLETLDVYGYPLCEDTYAASELNVQEAMYAGIPAVVFPHGGLKDLVVHEHTGLVVHSEQEYRHAIEYLFTHPDERLRLGKNARDYARQMFGAHNHAATMNLYYEKLLQMPKRKRLWPGRPLNELRGAEIFLESLDGAAPQFVTSLQSNDLGALFEAEEQILHSSYLMLNGGILPYGSHYAPDAHLSLWGGLAKFGNGLAVEGIPDLLGAFQLGLGEHSWRALWYLALAALDCGDPQLAQATLEKVVEWRPDFAPAREVLLLCQAGKPALTNRSILHPTAG